jgi:hypothetical protein
VLEARVDDGDGQSGLQGISPEHFTPELSGLTIGGRVHGFHPEVTDTSESWKEGAGEVPCEPSVWPEDYKVQVSWQIRDLT